MYFQLKIHFWLSKLVRDGSNSIFDQQIYIYVFSFPVHFFLTHAQALIFCLKFKIQLNHLIVRTPYVNCCHSLLLSIAWCSCHHWFSCSVLLPVALLLSSIPLVANCSMLGCSLLPSIIRCSISILDRSVRSWIIGLLILKMIGWFYL